MSMFKFKQLPYIYDAIYKMESKTSSSKVKILISYSEFERLKKIEEQFLELQKKHLSETSND